MVAWDTRDREARTRLQVLRITLRLNALFSMSCGLAAASGAVASSAELQAIGSSWAWRRFMKAARSRSQRLSSGAVKAMGESPYRPGSSGADTAVRYRLGLLPATLRVRRLSAVASEYPTCSATDSIDIRLDSISIRARFSRTVCKRSR